MSLLPNQTNVNEDRYFFLLVDSKVINTSTINANTGIYDKLFVNTISTGSVLVGNISTLTASISSLKTNSISSGTGYISSLNADSIKVSSLIGQTGFISSLFSDNVRVSSIEGQTGFISSLFSDSIKVSSIEGQTANISSINANNINFSSLIGDNISTNYISTNLLNSRSISTINLSSSNIASQNLSSVNIFFDTLNGTAGNITTLTGTNLVYSNGIFSNITTEILNADITVFNSTSIGYLVANNISTGFINSANGLFTNLFTSTITAHKGIFQSTATGFLIVNNISSGLIQSGNGLFNNLTASNLIIDSFSTLAVNVSTINTNNISSGLATISILNTSNITSYNITNSNLLSNAGDAQFNTLTTNGALNTNNSLNLEGGMNMNSDIIGRSNEYLSYDGYQVQFFQSLDQILNITTNELNVIGCGTGNAFNPLLPLRNNSIVNIGETQFAPGIVTIYGVSADFTNALTVYGITSFTGDATINGLTTVNGLTDLNGDLTVIGLTTITGDTDITGLTSITGNTDINGACEITGATNILGGLTVEAGIAVAGAMTFQAGVIEIGDPVPGITNNFNFYCYYSNAYFQNLNVNLNADFQQNVNVVGTLTANILNLNSTTSKYANISTLFVSSLIGYRGLFNSISTNYISTGALSVSEGIFNGISTNYISSGSLYSREINADTIYSFSTLTSTINFTSAKGELIELQADVSPGIVLYRNVDGVQEVDTILATNNVLGFNIQSISTIAIQAQNEIVLNSGKIIGLVATDLVVIDGPGLSVNSNATISSINTTQLTVSSILSSNIISETIFLQGTLGGGTGMSLYRNIQDTQVLDTDIAINDITGFFIQSISTINITADKTIGIGTNEQLLLSATNNITATTPQFNIVSNATVSSINTNFISTGGIYADRATIVNDLSANNLFTTNLLTFFIGNPLPFQSPVTFNDNLNISGNNISNTFLLQSSNISTNFISTGSLFVDNSVENSISSLRTSTGALFAGVISSIQFNASSINANRAFINNLTGSATATFTTNLYPQSAGAQLGFFGSAGTNSGGFYNQINVRSTLTQVIVPDVVGAFSNNIRVQGNLSTQNVFVSSINNKLYPYTSTLNIPFSTFSITGNQAGTPILLYSNVDFRTQGFHRISQKSIISKNTGGSSADIHANIFYTVGAFPSTPSITDGYSALPFINQDNASTFTTLVSEFYVSTPTTRNILYYDSTANNYTARLYMGTLFDTYTPQFGINPERIPNIL